MQHLQKLAIEILPGHGEATACPLQTRPCMDVSADAPNMQQARSTATGAGKRPAGVAQVAGAVIVSRSGDMRIAPVLAVDFYRGAK